MISKPASTTYVTNRLVAASRSSRCMPDWNVAVDRPKQQGEPKLRVGKPRRFLLRAKVDDDDDEERIESKYRHASNEKDTGNLKASNDDLIYYSAYTHSASSTYFKWVNLTAKEIHQSLTHRPGYTHSWLTTARGYDRHQPQLLFYLNHPIQFVQVVGVVVNTEEWYERFWLFTIDDSSGYTIDVVCRKPYVNKKAGIKNLVSEDTEEKEVQQELLQLSQQVEREVQIGAVLQVKGTVTLFQRRTAVQIVNSDLHEDEDVIDSSKKPDATRQISLQRLNVVHDTNAETALIAARTKFFRDVLSKPWHLSKKEQEKLYRKASGETDKARKRAKHHVERLKKVAEEDVADATKIVADYEVDEKGRAAAAEKAKEAGTTLLQEREAKVAQILHQPKQISVQDIPRQTIAEQTSKLAESTVHKRKRRSKRPAPANKPEVRLEETVAETTMSFGIDEDEKSALLRAAFGI